MTWPLGSLDLAIRPLRGADLEALLALHLASWRETYGPLLPGADLGVPLEVSLRRYWTRLLAPSAELRVLLGAERAGDLVAMAATFPRPDDPGTDHLTALHVMRGARSTGLGARLMAEVAERLAGLGRGAPDATVLLGNEKARAFYARLGGVEGARFEQEIAEGLLAPVVRIDLPTPSRLAEVARAEAMRAAPAFPCLQVRPAVPDDAPAITDIHVAAYEDTYGVGGEALIGIRAERAERWQRVLSGETRPFPVLVAADGAGIAGFAASFPMADDWSWEYLASLYVAPERRSQGVGALLMRELAARLATLGRTRMRALVLADNARARGFYARLGARETGSQAGDLAGRPVTDITLEWPSLAMLEDAARADLARRARQRLASGADPV